MSEVKAPRFSDEAVEILVQQVRSRQEIFYPSDGRRMPRQTLRQAWEEVALSVNARTEIIRTGLQCRKKFNDLTRTARDKLAHKPRKKSCIQDLTQMEQEALEIMWTGNRRRMQIGIAGGPLAQGLYHYLGSSMQEMEGAPHLAGNALSPAGAFQYADGGFSGGRDGQSTGYTQDNPFGDSNQKPSMLGRTAVGMGSRRGSSDSSTADGGTEEVAFSGPAFKRKIFHVHHQLLEALDSLSRSCLTLSERMEESVATLGDLLPQGLGTLQTTMERAVSSANAAATNSSREPATPALASLIEAQTGAIQALACSVTSGLEMLGVHIDRGFGRVAHLLQSTLPLAGSQTQARHRVGTASVADSALSQGDGTLIPKAIPQPVTTPRPGREEDRSAVTTAMIVQPPTKSLQTRALRDRRP
ncbi:uncharacterized protein LOC119976151 isoform X1 [Scyliorhinus canicula]|uniref:uncharacterized protein LOC119976151 isoform X1 n=1 Tax=Scyliorhinus canicula TaxID=7830 RepID=UPI0018F7C6C4|nr:uncharacterized protein LOC119976151 isoform X1 [Scyliorhinus canicula]